jgi:hypothetical protein
MRIYFQFELRIKVGIFIGVLNGINLVVQVLFFGMKRGWSLESERERIFGFKRHDVGLNLVGLGLVGMKEAWPINEWM